jgi:C4-dicarboxylate-specific signal transduction histidine kinase
MDFPVRSMSRTPLSKDQHPPRSSQPEGVTPGEPEHSSSIGSDPAVRGLAAGILGFLGVDLLYLGHFDAAVLGFRVVWTLNVLVNPWLLRSSPASWRRWLSYQTVAISTVCSLGLAWRMGGVSSPYFVLVPAMPLGIALMSWQDRWMSVVSGGVGILGTLALVLWQGRGPAESLTWVLMMVGTTVLADFLARQADQVQRAEQCARLERARRESLEALAFSEHRRAQSEKLALVGRLSAGVAHELNNPLAYVGSNIDYVRTELLSEGEVPRAELVEVLDETRAGLQHIRQIASDLRGFARMDANEPAECVLADVVADAIKLAALRLKHVAWLRVDVPTDLPEIFVVRQRLVQVVLNLLVNAGDALEAHQVKEGEVRVTGLTEGERVVVLVEDNGPGFAPHVLPRLFEAFFTTKGSDKGTGLGLTLSRELVVQFGGELTASNRPQGGARLRIELPVHRADSAEPSSGAPEDGARGAA